MLGPGSAPLGPGSFVRPWTLSIAKICRYNSFRRDHSQFRRPVSSSSAATIREAVLLMRRACDDDLRQQFE
jgi:hypothetical protein